MKFEKTKSFILILLVGISLVLTFGLWSYQPNLADIPGEGAIDEVNLGGIEETTRTLIHPKEIIFHIGNRHYGFENPVERNNLYQEIMDWRFYDFSTESNVESEANHYDVEVIFPTELPMKILNNIVRFNNQEVQLPTWSFRQIYFTFIHDTSSVNVEIISIDGSKKATAVINDSNHYDILNSYVNDGKDLGEYVQMNDSGSAIYIPKDPGNMTRLTGIPNLIDDEVVKNILFKDPTIVNQSTSTFRGLTYFTDNSQLRILQDGTRMLFVSPDSEDTKLLSFIDLLNRSIVNINGHSGWTDEYNLVEIDTTENIVRYQMYYQDYPVFSSSNLNLIEQKFNSQRLIEYNRPLIRLDFFHEGDEVELESSEEIISYLANQGYLENIKDIQIGYRLSYQSQADGEYPYLVFNPGWFMYYNNSWVEINTNNENSSLKGGD